MTLEEEEEEDTRAARRESRLAEEVGEGLLKIQSREDFLARAASVDGNELNESSWNDLNQLLFESNLLDLDQPNSLNLLEDFGEVIAVPDEDNDDEEEEGSAVTEENNQKKTTRVLRPALQLKQPTQFSPSSQSNLKTITALSSSITPNEEVSSDFFLIPHLGLTNDFYSILWWRLSVNGFYNCF